MTLLLDAAGWGERSRLSRGPWAPLVERLGATVDRLAASDMHVPRDKALLSRAGGRCAVDGTLLEYDPFHPSPHRCPQCGREYVGELHDRFRLYWHQLWLAERTLHAAVLWRLLGADAHRNLAERLIDEYCDAYLRYPNRDNTLGPTRVFFSTYLESIWLLQLALAVDVLESDAPTALTQRFRDRVAEPSIALIASYDEGQSNRQVWNDVAMFAAGRLLGRNDLVERSIAGPGGILSHLSTGLLEDGTWYEGENYHLFAHRGLWYAVVLAEHAGIPLPLDLIARFDRGFVTPFLTSFPDFTLPSRRDSQYAISLRQPRFAELCELGLARGADSRLGGILSRLYAADIPRAETGQSRSSADVERNLPASTLSRADLGWRALLFGCAELPRQELRPLGSVLLPRQGIDVFRRDRDRVMCALDFGNSGGGHGHPDRLNLLLGVGEQRWLQDVGTGSYVERTLHWYRSTLAHNAPLVAGQSQLPLAGRLLAHDERGAAGWVMAEALLDYEVTARRTVVILDGYLVDELQWSSTQRDIEVDLPFHVVGEADEREWRPVNRRGRGALEDGFDFIIAAEASAIDPGRTAVLRSRRGDAALSLWITPDADAELWRAEAPGPPGDTARIFQAIRTRGRGGRVRSVIAWDASVRGARVVGEAVDIELADGTRHVHRRTADGWQVELHALGARSSIDLGGVLPQSEQPLIRIVSEQAPTAPLELPAEWTLGREHYRRSEESWDEAGSPIATVRLEDGADGIRLVLRKQATAPLRINDDDAENPWDNEHPDVNAEGVQLHLDSDSWRLALRPGGHVRVQPIGPHNQGTAPRAEWREVPGGYELTAMLPVVPQSGRRVFRLDLLVNDIGAGRERRRGQLVMSGAAGEWVYLRGDRHVVPRHIPYFVVG